MSNADILSSALFASILFETKRFQRNDFWPGNPFTELFSKIENLLPIMSQFDLS
jgi:hypothetical protein